MQKPSDYFKKLDLAHLDANTAQFIREKILTLPNVDVLEGTREFETIKAIVEENFPRAIGIEPVVIEPIVEVIPEVIIEEVIEPIIDEKQVEIESISGQVSELGSLVELLNEMITENPDDLESVEVLELYNETLQDLKEQLVKLTSVITEAIVDTKENIEEVKEVIKTEVIDAKGILTAPKKYKTEDGQNVLGYESDWNFGLNNHLGETVVYYVSNEDDKDKYSVLSGILHKGELVYSEDKTSNKEFENYSDNVDDALKLAYELSLDKEAVDKYSLGGVLLGAALGVAGTLGYQKVTAKNSIPVKKEKVKEEKEKWNDVVNAHVNKEGLDSAMSDSYSDWKDVKAPAKFYELRTAYLKNRKTLENYIDKKLSAKNKEYVLGIINNEGFDSSFEFYSDFKEVKDAAFHKLIKSYLNSMKSLSDYIGLDKYEKGGSVNEKITKQKIKAKLYEPSGDFFIEDKGDSYILHFTPSDASKNNIGLQKMNAENVGKGYYGSAYSVKKNIEHKFEKGGSIGFIPMDVEEELRIVAKWGGTTIKGVIGFLSAMIDAGITKDDLELEPSKTSFKREKIRDAKIKGLWAKAEPFYKGELKGNMYYSTINDIVRKPYVLENFRPWRKTQKFENGGSIEDVSYDLIVRTPKGLVTKKDFDGFTKEEIIKWGTDRDWNHNPKGEKLGGQTLKYYEFFVKEVKQKKVKLPKKYEDGGDIEIWRSGSSIKFKTKKEAQSRLNLMKGDDGFRNSSVDKVNDGYVVKFEYLKKDESEKGSSLVKYVAVHESKDGYWTIASKPTTKELAEEMLGGTPKNEVGKVVTLEEARAHKKTVGEEYLYEKGGSISNKDVYKYGYIDGKPYEVIGINHKLGLVRVKNFSESGMKEMKIVEWIPYTFELGTPAYFIDDKGREVSGEIIMKNGRKAISLYKDSNYSGIHERILFLDEIDLSTLKSFMSNKEKFENGGKISNEIVLNEGNGIVINNLYNKWQKIKTEKEHDKWSELVKNTKFGTYGTIGIFEVLQKFEPKFPNDIIKRDFTNELKKALGVSKDTYVKFENGGEVIDMQTLNSFHDWLRFSSKDADKHDEALNILKHTSPTAEDNYLRKVYPKYKDEFNAYIKENPDAFYEYKNGGEVGDNKHTYMMLGRLQMDNDYFLGNGNRGERNLWAGNVDGQIEEMKKLWNSLPENGKPEWLSMEDILDYERKMKGIPSDSDKDENIAKIRFNDHWKTVQLFIDGSLYGEFDNYQDAINNAKNNNSKIVLEDDVTMLNISSENPLSRQLSKITGDGWNDIDYENLDGSKNVSTIKPFKHIKSGKIFEVVNK
jgi:hypothetical protein